MRGGAAPGPGGFRVERHASVGSTNDVLRARAAAGEPAGLLVVADEQTAGRGRRGRTWVSPANGNLYASLLLRPGGDMAAAATLSLVVSLAVVDALAAGIVPDPDGRLAVKWPNDVLLDGAKLAGILLEGEDDGAGGCAWLIAGVGLNLAAAPEGMPYPVASLAAATGERLTPDAFVGLWLPALARRLDAWAAGGFGALRDAWLARAHGLGRPASLRVGPGGATVSGRFADLAEDGAVLLESAPGRVERYAAGELFFP